MIYRIWDKKRGAYIDDHVVLPDGSAMYEIVNYKEYYIWVDRDNYKIEWGFEYDGEKYYEGDILKVDISVFKVVWRDIGFIFSSVPGNTAFNPLLILKEKVRVIGNINITPED